MTWPRCGARRLHSPPSCCRTCAPHAAWAKHSPRRQSPSRVRRKRMPQNRCPLCRQSRRPPRTRRQCLPHRRNRRPPPRTCARRQCRLPHKRAMGERGNPPPRRMTSGSCWSICTRSRPGVPRRCCAWTARSRSKSRNRRSRSRRTTRRTRPAPPRSGNCRHAHWRELLERAQARPAAARRGSAQARLPSRNGAGTAGRQPAPAGHAG